MAGCIEDCSTSASSDTIAAMRRVWMILPVAVLIVSGCSSKSSTGAIVCDSQFWNGTIAACLPTGWRVLSSDNLRTLGVPEETVTAFQVSEPRAGQLDTVTVTRESLTQELTSLDYSNANILSVSALPDYKLMDKQAVYIDGKETAIHVFSARPVPDAPVRRYYQLSAVKDRTGYTFTGSFPLSITDQQTNEVMFILKNVSFTEQKTSSSSSK